MPSSNGHATGKTVHFDKAKVSRLRKAYIVAKAENLDVFIFEGSELDINYAKYLLEYLGDHFK